MRRPIATLCLTTLLTATVALSTAARSAEPRLDFDTVFADHAGGRSPEKLTWDEDGRRLAYLWHGDLILLDTSTGESSTVVTPAGLAQGIGSEGALDIDDYHWRPGGDSLLIESAGDLFLWTLASASASRLTDTQADEEDPKFAPSGRTIAFVRDADLHLLDPKSGAERALTQGGAEDRILHGKTDWVYWEELWSRDSTGFWWSPRSDKIAYYRFDESPVRSYPLVDFTSQYPQVEWQKYPKAGEDNPLVTIGVLDVESGETTWLATGDETDVYYPRVDWLPSGQRVAVQRMNRDQTRIDLLLCDPVNGACTELFTEELTTWVNVTKDLRFLADGSFLWTSEASGWRALYLHGADGSRLRQLSPDGWAVTRLDHFEPATGTAVFTAYSTGPLGAAHRRILRVTVDGVTTEPLSEPDEWSSATVAPRTGRWVHSRSRSGSPTSWSVRDAAGEVLAELPFELGAGVQPQTLPQWELFEIPGPEGSPLPAAFLRPADFDDFATYPAIMYHYGGPASQVVRDAWRTRSRGLWFRMMAQRGYAILLVDNQGSNYFGKHGADRLHRRFGEVNLAAQRAGVEYLKSLGWVDAERIGLWGWSGGGSNTLYSVLNSPGTWKAAVAGAPVTDWYFYDTIWTERYLDHPDDNPEGYRLSSAVTHAANLRDALLIVHGTADDNVHPQNTLAMAHKLIAAGRPFEQAIHPRQKHGFRGIDSRHFYERMTEFFDRHLAP